MRRRKTPACARDATGDRAFLDLIEIKIGATALSDNNSRMGTNVVFKCPRTGMNVQHSLDEKAAEQPESTYEAVVCKACTGLHFINRTNGKLLGQD